MQSNIEETTEPKKRTYMRLYKRAEYLKNGEKIKAKNRAYYYKYKFGLNSDEMHKYGTLLPLVSKIK
jgi:hypothetical protein